MRELIKALSGLVLVLVFLCSITFSHWNTAEVSITVGHRQFAPLPVSVWIIGAFVSGGAIGLLLGVGLLRQLRSRVELRRLRRKLAEAQREVQQLRAMTRQNPP